MKELLEEESASDVERKEKEKKKQKKEDLLFLRNNIHSQKPEEKKVSVVDRWGFIVDEKRNQAPQNTCSTPCILFVI